MLPSEEAFIYPAVARHIEGECLDDLELGRDETLTRKWFGNNLWYESPQVGEIYPMEQEQC